MKDIPFVAFVHTQGEKCRVCYTCVRECPAKAIRIMDGQAEILPERCICCGNCVMVCSQGAKQVRDTNADIVEIIAGGGPVAAIIAPSFPAEFPDIDAATLAGMIRKLGCSYVNEVAFGADLVAQQYRDLLLENPESRYISTSCPAIVDFVESYHPELVQYLAPIVSPMVAEARVLRAIHGDDIKIIFIGPCVAKKKEARSTLIEGDVDGVMTFGELRRLFADQGICPQGTGPSDFDPPWPGLGALFPISRGLLQAADIQEDILVENVIAADGRANYTEALKEFEMGVLKAQLLEVLCCQGCIMGPGMTTTDPLFTRRSRVRTYVSAMLEKTDPDEWRSNMQLYGKLDFSRAYQINDQRIAVEDEERIREILAKMGKFSPEDELNCCACGYHTCREHAIAILKGFAESEMCLPYTIDQLKNAYADLEDSHKRLASTQAALMQAEKLANMGQIAAGIAHEVNNPLGVVLLYAHLLMDEIKDSEHRQDMSMIVEQADRCKKIVSGLLNFARQRKTVLERTNVVAHIDAAIKALHLPDAIKTCVRSETDDPYADIDKDQIIQVLTNLVSNAQAAMPEGGDLTISVGGDETQLRFSVRDTGAGIAKQHLGKIFDPFFTTKQIGRGTGLGLAVTYGIIKMHHGDIQVESNCDPQAGPAGTVFTVSLPRKGPPDQDSIA